MKNILIALAALIVSFQASANYLIIYNVEPEPNSIKITGWFSSESTYTTWQNVGEPYGCSNWTPDESTIPVGQSFTQDRSCSINQERFKQDRQINEKGLYKDVGEPILETRTENVVQTRSSNGVLESWVAIGAIFTEWTNVGTKYDCSNWTPDPSTVGSGEAFTQNATDCKQNQTRNKQEREQETTTLQIRNVGDLLPENNILTNQSDSRSAVGTKVNKVCLYTDASGSNTQMWYSYSGGETFWTVGYQSIPYMWIDVVTGKGVDFGFGGGVVYPGLTKISGTEFRYNDGAKVWKITRGNFVSSASGNTYYQICYE